jgi:methylmalonyl-CoA/ethylmalonyl-CoA epimerase
MSSTAPTEKHEGQVQEERRLHHIGFVLKSITAAIQDFAKSVSCTWDGTLVFDPLQKVRVAFLKGDFQGEPLIELVEPAGEDSPVNAFLARGSGLHHLCFEVNDLDAELSKARGLGGLTVRPPLPATAFAGRRIAWVYTKNGLLLEYLEK